MPPPNEQQNQDKFIAFKITLIGPSASGKSALINKYIGGESSPFIDRHTPTAAATFYVKRGKIAGKNTKLQVWDTGGADRYKSLVPMFTKGAAAILITFDLTSTDTIDLQSWINQARSGNDENLVIVIVGTKANSETTVKEAELKNLARGANFPCFITDARNYTGVDELFTETTRLCFKQRETAQLAASSSSSSSSNSVGVVANSPTIPTDFEKVVILGDASSGKTALVSRYVKGTFSNQENATIGANCFQKDLESSKRKLSIWDTSGNEKSRDFISNYISGAAVVQIVFDLTSKDPINLDYWLQLTKQRAPNAKIILVGTKDSHTTGAKNEELNHLAKQHNLPVFITNAESGTYIPELFQETARLCEEMELAAQTQARKENVINKLQTYINRIENKLLPLNTNTNNSSSNGSITDPLLTSVGSVQSPQSPEKQEIPIENINFAAGFWIMKESQSANRKANYLLAKQLLAGLSSETSDINTVFTDLPAQRALVISHYNIQGHKDRGIRSDELNAAIAEAYTLKKA